MDGVLLVNKEEGLSSFDVVRKIKKVLNTKKVGHCGTLDPLATGLLVVTVGKALKISRFLESDEKEYIATIKFGERTATLDREGEVVEERKITPFTEEDIKKVFSSLIGITKQKPPIYSALSVNGKRLYEYARENIEVEIKERDIEIKELELLEFDNDSLKYRVVCSKGTYVRVLCETIANKLNNIGYMTSLIRTRIGKLGLDNSYSLEQIEEGKYKLIDIENSLSNFVVLVVKDRDLYKASNGNVLDFYIEGNVLVVDESRDVIALYEGDKENNRLNILIDLFGQETPVEVELYQVSKI